VQPFVRSIIAASLIQPIRSRRMSYWKRRRNSILTRPSTRQKFGAACGTNRFHLKNRATLPINSYLLALHRPLGSIHEPIHAGLRNVPRTLNRSRWRFPPYTRLPTSLASTIQPSANPSTVSKLGAPSKSLVSRGLSRVFWVAGGARFPATNLRMV
jgi:hypothetical protein